jgi:predicted small secreted protein
MKRAIAWFLLLLALFSLPACNTLKGAGQDIERAGEELDEEF